MIGFSLIFSIKQNIIIRQFKLEIIMTQLAMLLRHAKRSNAKEVDLSSRGLQFIPKEVYTIVGIQNLNLSDNKISHVDSQIKLLKNLNILNLANNLLMDLPKELITLKKLQVMIVHGNPLNEKYSKLLAIKPEQDLTEYLKQCLPTSGTQSVIDTPSWLKESQHEVKAINIQKEQHGKGLNWEQNKFAKQSRRMPRTQMKHPEKKISVIQSLSTQNIAKEGVLEIKLNQLQIGQQISMGGFSTIHEGSYFGLEVAVKKVFNPNINEQLMAEFNNQIKMLSKYRHPNIILMIGAVTIPPALCIVMEYIKQGTLFDLLHRKKFQLDDKQKSKITKQLILVLQYLHSHGIVHRDIKSHNILIDNNKSIKICDFGLAKHKSELNTGPMQFSGTPTYMAQQLFLKKAYDQSVDIFALGTLIYQLYSGEIPYAGLDPTDIKEKVLKDSSFSNKLKVKKPVLQIVNRCRSIQVKQRPNIKQLAKFIDW